MVDNSGEGRKGFDTSQDNWDFVSAALHELETWSSSSSCKNLEHECDDGTSSYAMGQLINMNYFANPSDELMNNPPVEENIFANNGIIDIDWIEPSTPIQSCALPLSSEDDDSSSKSCSSDYREGLSDHLLREREVSGGESGATLLHDISPPKEGIEEVEMTNTKEPSWRAHVGAWLCEAGRCSTFCSIALAATVIGLVLIGSGWQRLRLHYCKLRCHLLSKAGGKVVI